MFVKVYREDVYPKMRTNGIEFVFGYNLKCPMRLPLCIQKRSLRELRKNIKKEDERDRNVLWSRALDLSKAKFEEFASKVWIK